MWPIGPGEFTTADLDAAPDEGARYELVDGILLVTHLSSLIHQQALGDLMLRMAAACPADLEVLPGPLEFRPNSRLAVVPDLLVRYVERAVVRGGEVFEAAVPFPVRLEVSRPGVG